MPSPNGPALQRLTAFAQGAAFAPGANNLGWLFGNGLAARSRDLARARHRTY